jgi:hypothetical protein
MVVTLVVAVAVLETGLSLPGLKSHHKSVQSLRLMHSFPILRLVLPALHLYDGHCSLGLCSCCSLSSLVVRALVLACISSGGCARRCRCL